MYSVIYPRYPFFQIVKNGGALGHRHFYFFLYLPSKRLRQKIITQTFDWLNSSVQLAQTPYLTQFQLRHLYLITIF